MPNTVLAAVPPENWRTGNRWTDSEYYGAVHQPIYVPLHTPARNASSSEKPTVVARNNVWRTKLAKQTLMAYPFRLVYRPHTD